MNTYKKLIALSSLAALLAAAQAQSNSSQTAQVGSPPDGQLLAAQRFDNVETTLVSSWTCSPESIQAHETPWGGVRVQTRNRGHGAEVFSTGTLDLRLLNADSATVSVRLPIAAPATPENGRWAISAEFMGDGRREALYYRCRISAEDSAGELHPLESVAENGRAKTTRPHVARMGTWDRVTVEFESSELPSDTVALTLDLVLVNATSLVCVDNVVLGTNAAIAEFHASEHEGEAGDSGRSSYIFNPGKASP